MSEIETHGVVKSLVRIFKVEWRNVIYPGRDQRVWIRKSKLSVGWDRYG